MLRRLTRVSEPAHEPPARCDARQRHEILQEARQLGVPHSYARTHHLRLISEPRALKYIGDDVHQRAQWLASRAAQAFLRMRTAAAEDAVELQLVSAFRSAAYQLDILKRKLERGQSIEEILRVSAAPGYSEHHSGRVVDLTTPGYAALEEEFERSQAFTWLQLHAPAFGFALSYPRENPHGITYEPWHWCWHARRRERNPAA